MTAPRHSVAIPVNASYDVGESRRQALMFAAAASFDETARGRVSLVVTEFATNLVKHTSGGVIVLRRLVCGASLGVEIMSLDRGPGLDADMCLRDGYSTTGSPGTGLGAVRRLSNRFDIYSIPTKGSVLAATLWADQVQSREAAFDFGAVCLPMDGEVACGDGWYASGDDRTIRMMTVDGLGHGPLAAHATDTAIAAFSSADAGRPEDMMRSVSQALKLTRGAAVAIATVDFAQNTVAFAGIGNIGAYIFSGPKPKGMVSLNGIVGHQVRKISEFSYPFDAADTIVMHSDGLSSHFRLEEYPGLAYRPACLIAGVLYRDFHRARDDAMVVVLRRSGS